MTLGKPGKIGGTIVAVAVVALAAGYGQFGAVSALGQVATAFGHQVHTGTVAEEAGLSGATLGIGLAILRLASVLGQPLAAAADRLGRRPSVAFGAAGIGLSAIIVYSGTGAAVVVGYLLTVLSAGFLAPAGTALPNELFETSVRASVAGWGIAASVLGAIVGLLAFGLIADSTGSFEAAAVAVSLPVLGVLGLIRRVPETRGAVLAGTIGAQR